VPKLFFAGGIFLALKTGGLCGKLGGVDALVFCEVGGVGALLLCVVLGLALAMYGGVTGFLVDARGRCAVMGGQYAVVGAWRDSWRVSGRSGAVLALVLLLLVTVQQLLYNISTAVRGLLLGRVGLLMAERGGTRGRHHGGLSLSRVCGSVR
jgi:hypothetical protein